ncbi:MAG: molybdopterin-dependent oxidoreductase [Gammaproteobacteria bacterium]|nr:molybdopterin-dependent oxidoreductase [Gammaproteobacteria bacterium]
MTKQVKTYCRFCHAYCPMVATVENNKLIDLQPDTDNEVYGGYTCIKGRQLIEQIDHPTRLQQSQKRQADGSYADIATASALDEISDKLQAILEKYGPRSIASYNGTYSYQNSAAHDVARAFHGAISSPSYYTSVTIDQPAKVAIGPARMGWWNGGGHMWNDSDVALIIGCNTLVSHFSIPGGIPSFSPHNALREGKKRGMKVICIDPRETEVAKRADLHLQVRPGHDAALVAALLNVIISESLYDKAFCDEHTDHFSALASKVSEFTPEAVATAAGITAQQIYDAARLFAAGPRGTATTGTGPEMGPHPNLLQHLVQSLNAICGRFCREGERMPNPGVLTPDIPRLAQATGPQQQWLNECVKSRVSDDIGESTVLSPYGPKPEMPTAVLTDEILTEGEGQIKALLVIGGQPLLAFPDQEKTLRALQSLELLVCVDLKMSPTAQLADYVLAPKLCLEREDVTLLTDIWHDKPYSQYTPTVVEAEGDKIEEWELFWELGKRMGLDLHMANGPIDMVNKPAKFDLLKLITQGSRVPLEVIRDTQGGKVYDVPDVIVGPPDPETAQRLELYPPGLDEELASALADLNAASSADYPLLLISRRMKNTYNSTGPELSLLKKKGTTNPAFMHSQELERWGISSGEIINVRSAKGMIPAVAQASDDVRPGVISMAHCWGGSPDPEANSDGKVRDIGSNTNRLIDNRKNNERYSGMPRQSCIPVAVSKLS